MQLFGPEILGFAIWTVCSDIKAGIIKKADKGRYPGDVGAIQKVKDGEKGYGICIEAAA